MWLYQDTPVEQLPANCIGFVYLITNTVTQRKYVGKKLATFARTRQRTVVLKNGEKRKKKIRDRVESDWQSYYGSSLSLQEDVNTLGADKFKREILYFCTSKAECTYLEAREQFSRRVLETEEYYNENIMCKIHGSHIRGKVNV